jgi:hypothetical protein
MKKEASPPMTRDEKRFLVQWLSDHKGSGVGMTRAFVERFRRNPAPSFIHYARTRLGFPRPTRRKAPAPSVVPQETRSLSGPSPISAPATDHARGEEARLTSRERRNLTDALPLLERLNIRVPPEFTEVKVTLSRSSLNRLRKVVSRNGEALVKLVTRKNGIADIQVSEVTAAPPAAPSHEGNGVVHEGAKPSFQCRACGVKYGVRMGQAQECPHCGTVWLHVMAEATETEAKQYREGTLRHEDVWENASRKRGG